MPNAGGDSGGRVGCGVTRYNEDKDRPHVRMRCGSDPLPPPPAPLPPPLPPPHTLLSPDLQRPATPQPLPLPLPLPLPPALLPPAGTRHCLPGSRLAGLSASGTHPAWGWEGDRVSGSMPQWRRVDGQCHEGEGGGWGSAGPCGCSAGPPRLSSANAPHPPTRPRPASAPAHPLSPPSVNAPPLAHLYP